MNDGIVPALMRTISVSFWRCLRQEKLDRCRERKDELKQRVVDLEDQLDEAKKAHG